MMSDIVDRDREADIANSDEKTNNSVGFGRNAEEFLMSLSDKGTVSSAERSDSGIYILSLTSAGTSRVRVSVLIENSAGREEREYLLLNEICNGLGLSVGSCEGELVDEIEYYAGVSEAYDSACASFASVQSSLSKLKQKLKQKGYSRDICDAAIEIFEARGIVDEEKLALNRLKVFLEKRWGRSRIFSKLREEGFSDIAIDAVSDELESVDFVSNCATLIERKFGSIPEDRRETEKLFASLSRYGYSGSEIKSAIKMLLSN